MDRVGQARQVVRVPLGVGQLEQPHEHRRDDLRVGDPITLDRREKRRRLETLHDDDGAAEALHRHAITQRRSVVERRGRQIDRLRAKAVERLRQPDERVGRVERPIGKRTANALRPAGGAARIQHVAARRLIGDRRLGLRRHYIFEARPACAVAADDEARRNLEMRRESRKAGRRDDRTRA